MKLVMASTTYRGFLKSAPLLKTNSAEIVLYREDETTREITAARIYSRSRAVIKTTRLFDYNEQRKMWTTDGGSRYDDADGTKAVNKLVAEMLAEIDGKLELDERNSNHAIRMHYLPENQR